MVHGTIELKLSSGAHFLDFAFAFWNSVQSKKKKIALCVEIFCPCACELVSVTKLLDFCNFQHGNS